ncbi:MAG: aminotransferase class I/II-fold pyridoxal phosphate-dependent enzyme [candidate division Zixibacteria bacterium]|nr:aminotransferase class I/II-fold pyridoxal phosphate-dependent enzyme [candidate division Zixibacteria bacterium]
MQVPLLDLKRQYHQIKEEVDRAVAEVLEDTKYIMGPQVLKFEDEIAEYCGTKYAVGVASGTDALLIALRACGVNPGDEVITSTFSFFASAGVISRLGATPVFVDIEDETCNLNPDLLEQAITEKTKVVMPVHIFGQCADMGAITEVAKKHNLMIVEDSAQAIGARYKDKMAGTMGEFGCFSFFPSKNLGGAGDGGMIISNYLDKQTFMKSLRDHGANPKYYHSYIGYNSRLDTLQAAILSVKLKYLDQWTEKRRANAAFYDQKLSGLPLTLPKENSNCYHIYNQYTIATEKRDDLIEYLNDNGVACAIYYPVPLHAQKCYSYLNYDSDDFPVAERLSRQVLSIPIFPDLTDEEKEYVVQKLTEYFS